MNHSGFRAALWLRRLGILVPLALLVGAAIYIWGPKKGSKAALIPSVEVKLGDFVDYVELRGEISVRSSIVITAPYNAGDLQILKLARNSAQILKGEVVVEFDPTSLQRNIDQYRATLKQVEAEIARANAQQRLLEEQNRTDVVNAQFGLERARLDASARDVLPAKKRCQVFIIRFCE